MSHDGDLGRILVVDDEEPVRDVLCEYFEGQGFGVEAAPDGEAALAAARLGESGQLAEANQHLRELTLLLRIAAELGDLTGPDLAAAESALASARRVPPAAG
jgi:CheY-like chemotaxis protein